MELVSLIWLCAGLCLAIIFHKLYSLGLFYCIKWLVIYTILQWRRFSTNHRELGVPIFASKKEEYLENPRIWSREKTFRRDSMLVFAGSSNVWLLLELARGRHNSAAARLRLQFGPSGPVYQTSDHDSRPRACEGWTTNSLSLQCLEPMRRWRIVFTGRLHSRNNSGQKDTQLVKINLIWVALSGPYYYGNDANIPAVTAELAEHPFSNLRINLESLGKGYEQWGVVQGTCSIDGSVTNIHVPSLRSHCWKWPHVSARLAVVGIVGDGTLFSIGYNFAKFRSQLGHVRYTDGRIETLVGTSEVDSPTVGDKFVRTFKSGCYDHQAYVVRSQFQPWGPQHIATARCTFDSSQATCVLLSWAKGVQEDLPILPLLQCSLTESVELVIPLDHPACTNPAVVGGKAASLALLVETTHTLLRNKAVVPAGFCLTVHAMQLQALSSQHLSSAVKLLSLVSSGQEPGDLQEHCQHAVTAWLTVPMCTAVVAVLSGRVMAGRSYAVRSSSTMEDAADTSAAGQNATVLGCVGLDAVVSAVHKCWSSLYTYQSIQYRRQSGQPLDVLMAVVVQEMVEADSAGVMFTRHPVTADPGQLLITANYGLGETVVSGTVEPDTVVVNTENSRLMIESKVKGSKSSRIVVSEAGVVEEEATTEDMSQSDCLSEAEIIALAKVGLTLEQLFGWPRDVEWAIHKGVIYLLQCRPVTSLLSWSQDELIHELDSAILPNDATTTANTGEVLPGATSPLCQSTNLRCADFVMIPLFAGINHPLWYNNSRIATSHHHALLNIYNTILKGAEEKPTLSQKVLELAVCGHKISTTELQREAASRATPLTITQKLQLTAFFIIQILVSRFRSRKAQKIGETFRIRYDTFTSPSALYAYLTASYATVLEVLRLHTRVSLASTLWQTILFSLLAGDNQELTEESLQDIARLLVGKQTAVSAQIPADIKELTKTVKTCDKWPELIALQPEKIPVWLDINCPLAADMLKSIIHRYEHRNNKELDLMTKTWGLDSSPLLAMIHTMLKTSSDSEPVVQLTRTDSDSDIISHLKCIKKPVARWVIRQLMGLASTAAGRREVTKDASLRMVHQLRLGYLWLAHLMSRDARLPGPELLWFCTHHEISLLLRGSNPQLLHKISRRQRSWQQWDRLQFPEVMTGLPVPVQFSSHPSMSSEEQVQGTLVCPGSVRGRACVSLNCSDSASLQAGDILIKYCVQMSSKARVQGTLVCPGSVRGRACVLLNCSDSASLQAGDILITHSTDVGWTPLFPLLAGVVTELGGLISHGAVVAREYGLPCVVGATNATLIFKTGDEVYLDGQSGLVQKVSSVAKQNQNS